VEHFGLILSRLVVIPIVLLTLSAVTTGAHAALFPPINTNNNITSTLIQRSESDHVVTEATAQSKQDALIGHQGHQAIVVLPLRSDHKLWSGTISWTASKPIELRLLYDYNSSLVVDSQHARPITAPLALTTESPPIPIGEVAISLIKPFNGPPVVSSFDSGSMPFIAKGVALHNVNGTKFTATYAVDANAVAMNK
jgi:hypothetical protein